MADGYWLTRGLRIDADPLALTMVLTRTLLLIMTMIMTVDMIISLLLAIDYGAIRLPNIGD